MILIFYLRLVHQFQTICPKTYMPKNWAVLKWNGMKCFLFVMFLFHNHVKSKWPLCVTEWMNRKWHKYECLQMCTLYNKCLHSLLFFLAVHFSWIWHFELYGCSSSIMRFEATEAKCNTLIVTKTTCNLVSLFQA